MELLIGTRGGAFAVDGKGEASPLEGLAEADVLTLCKADGGFLAGTQRGVFRSADGRSWQASGIEERAVRAIAAAPGDGAVYAGTQPAALFRSEDGGSSWTEVASMRQVPGVEGWGLPGEPDGSRALSIVFDAKAPEHCYVGVEVGGIVKTADGGKSWTVGEAGNNPDIHMLALDPVDRDVVYAATGFGRVGAGTPETTAGVYKSEDGGSSWSYVWPDAERRYTRPMVIDARAPHALTVASTINYRSSHRDPEGAHSMLYQSTDQGKNWRSLGDGAHSPSAANITALALGEEPGSVYAGTDNGEVWKVSASAEWGLVVSGLPYVQSLLTVE
jgi:photosystem II stability/assembly factor-like uncharacterized protein